jgi:serine/threonine protein kinase
LDDLIIPISEIDCINLIGRGAYGNVWKATWKGSGSGLEVAVKKIGVNLANENNEKDIYKEVHILYSNNYNFYTTI